MSTAANEALYGVYADFLFLIISKVFLTLLIGFVAKMSFEIFSEVITIILSDMAENALQAKINATLINFNNNEFTYANFLEQQRQLDIKNYCNAVLKSVVLADME